MAYETDIYVKASEILNKRKEDAEKKAEAKNKLFESLEPDYIKYRQDMIFSVKEAVKAIDMKPEEAFIHIEKQKEKNLKAQDKIKELLIKNNLPSDYLNVKYYCPICSDTGINNGKLCKCHIELLKKLSFEEAGKKSPLKFCRFEDFKLSYYSDKYNEEYLCSPRERISLILDFCKEYAESFDTDSPNLFMYGETGLGKTHLSLSIAGKVIEKGFSVIYNSAQNIFNELQKERFGKGDQNSKFEAMVLECDLLVIDDLGAEFSTQFTNSALYNIINTRINSLLPTIISTNLTLKDIEDRYTRRVSSRIIGEYEAFNFIGADIRQLKNE